MGVVCGCHQRGTDTLEGLAWWLEAISAQHVGCVGSKLKWQDCLTKATGDNQPHLLWPKHTWARVASQTEWSVASLLLAPELFENKKALGKEPSKDDPPQMAGTPRLQPSSHWRRASERVPTGKFLGAVRLSGVGGLLPASLDRL